MFRGGGAIRSLFRVVQWLEQGEIGWYGDAHGKLRICESSHFFRCEMPYRRFNWRLGMRGKWWGILEHERRAGSGQCGPCAVREVVVSVVMRRVGYDYYVVEYGFLHWMNAKEWPML